MEEPYLPIIKNAIRDHRKQGIEEIRVSPKVFSQIQDEINSRATVGGDGPCMFGVPGELMIAGVKIVQNKSVGSLWVHVILEKCKICNGTGKVALLTSLEKCHNCEGVSLHGRGI